MPVNACETTKKQSQYAAGLWVHHLDGCRPTPLAHYLKALGVLRLVSEQIDPQARGWWHDDTFCLSTYLSRDELENFFLNDYAPTPLVAPWNGGSGFYPKDNKIGRDGICKSSDKRWSEYQVAIDLALRAVGTRQEKPEKGEKNTFIAMCRNQWRGRLLQWLDAAVVLSSDGDPAYPAMLGTGGNDGHLDFTNNFMQNLSSIFQLNEDVQKPVSSEAVGLLKSSLFADVVLGHKPQSIGQFAPGSASGVNGSVGFNGSKDVSKSVNLWDFVLMLEGTIAFVSGVSRRNASESLPQAAAPFAVRASNVGYNSSTADKSRGEQWMPLWSSPATMSEITILIREGRNQLGRHTPKRGIDFAKAISRMGADRGITAFERYGYIERNGQAYLAIPLGRFEVAEKPHQGLLDEVADWLESLGRIASDKNAPAAFSRVHHVCEEAVLSCCQHGQPTHWQDLLVALGQAEDQFIRSPKLAAKEYAKPIPKLSAHWLKASQTDDVTWRLAKALAGQGSVKAFEKSKNKYWPDWNHPVRRHWLPLNKKWNNQFETNSDQLNIQPEQVCIGLDLDRCAAALLHRRCIEMRRNAITNINHHLPLFGCSASFASLDDIEEWLNGNINRQRVLQLARGLMALDWRNTSTEFDNSTNTDGNTKMQTNTLGPLAIYGTLRLALSPIPIEIKNTQISPRLNPAIFKHLCSGNLNQAIILANRQLQAVGLRSQITCCIGDINLTRRITTALAFAIKPKDLSRLAIGLTHPKTSNTEMTK